MLLSVIRDRNHISTTHNTATHNWAGIGLIWLDDTKPTDAWADVQTIITSVNSFLGRGGLKSMLRFKDVVQTVVLDFPPFYRTVVPLRDFPIGKSADTNSCKTNNVEVCKDLLATSG